MSDGLRLLRSIIHHGSTEKLHDIGAEIFNEGPERDAYDFLRHHYSDHNVLPDIGTLEDHIEQDIPNAPEPADFYLDICLDRETYNAVRPVFHGMQDALRDRDIVRVRELSAEMARASRVRNREEDILDMETIVRGVVEGYDRNHNSGVLPGIPTGWESVDDETQGWQKGDLVIVVARPGIGKTNLLIHSARHAWRKGRSVLLASMEMSSSQIGYRFVAQCAGVNPSLYRRGHLCQWGRNRVNRTLEELSDDRRFHLYAGEFKTKSAGALDLVIQEYSPDAVYIDGMYLMTSEGAPRGVGRYEKVAYVTDELKSIALRRDRPIIATTQFGRGAGKGGSKGDLENIGYTDTLSTHASIIIGIKVPKSEQAARYPKTRALEFLKGREGETGSVLVNHTFSPLNFTEREETTDEYNARLDAEEAEDEEPQPARGQQRQQSARSARNTRAGSTTDFMGGPLHEGQ